MSCNHACGTGRYLKWWAGLSHQCARRWVGCRPLWANRLPSLAQYQRRRAGLKWAHHRVGTRWVLQRSQIGWRGLQALGWRGGRVVRWCWVIFQCRSVLLIWIIVGQGPTALTVGAGGGCLDIFSLVYHFSLLSPSLWETARYRLKYCLKGPLNPKQPTNQPTLDAKITPWYANRSPTINNEERQYCDE